ncbi:MAG: ABC transporter permease subunit [Saprospiraceae bacterium]
MILYILKRLLYFIPTLLVISLFAFFLSKNAPGDPVERFFEKDYTPQQYAEKARMLSLDLPVFYFSIQPEVLPDTFYKLLQPYKKEVVRELSILSQDYSLSLSYYNNVESSLAALNSEYTLQKNDSLLQIINLLKPLLTSQDLPFIAAKGEILDTLNKGENEKIFALKRDIDLLKQKCQSPGIFASTGNKWVWHGLENQYQTWVINLLKGNPGFSLVSGKAIGDRIGAALKWTLTINLIAVFLAFLIAIPIGVHAAVHAGSRKETFISLFIYFLYSLPVFWIGTMLLVFFTTPEYGMDWFAGVGLGREFGHSNSWELFLDRASHLILPLICLVYPTLAYISRQLKGSMEQELKKDYIRTARAKGIAEKTVIWKHAFRNSLFPLVTLFSSILPSTIAGSLVIEVIFNIPGMGKLMVDGIIMQDWPIVFTILLLGGMLTITGILLSDLLYAKLDPRVRL